MANKMLRGGVFGFGGMGQEFATRINFDRWYGDDVEIVGVCDRGEEKRRLAESRFGLKAFEDPRELVNEGLDFALVTSTTVAHVEHGCLLAEAGVPMLMEKPIALTLEDAQQMLDAVDTHGVGTVVNFQKRFAPEYQKLRQVVQDGEVGDPISMEASMYRGHGFYAAGARHRAVVEPEESGGWIVHHACHAVDIACWILGEVESVSTITRSTVAGGDSEEIVMGRLLFKRGAVASIFDTTGGVRAQHVAIAGVEMRVRYPSCTCACPGIARLVCRASLIRARHIRTSIPSRTCWMS